MDWSTRVLKSSLQNVLGVESCPVAAFSQMKTFGQRKFPTMRETACDSFRNISKLILLLVYTDMKE